MVDFLKFLKGEVEKNLGGTMVLVLAIVGLAVYVWYQHHRQKILEDQLKLEADRRQFERDRAERLAQDLDRGRKQSSEAQSMRAPGVRAEPDMKLGPNLRTARILFVEDNVDARESVSMFLEMLGASPIEGSADGEDALKRIRAQPPDLMILDMGLPKKDGWELLRDLRRAKTRLPTLIISGYGQAADIQRAKDAIGNELGGCIYMTKPADPERLVAALNKLAGDSAAADNALIQPAPGFTPLTPFAS